jgi:hypothetical protein
MKRLTVNEHTNQSNTILESALHNRHNTSREEEYRMYVLQIAQVAVVYKLAAERNWSDKPNRTCYRIKKTPWF